MIKSEAIQLLGGTQVALARAVGISESAVSQWPNVLKRHHINQVQAALWRKAMTESSGHMPLNTPQPNGAAL